MPAVASSSVPDKSIYDKTFTTKNSYNKNNVTPSERWGPDGVTKLGLEIAEKRFKKETYSK